MIESIKNQLLSNGDEFSVDVLRYIYQLEANVDGGETAIRQLEQEVEALRRETPQWHGLPTCEGYWICVPDQTIESLEYSWPTIYVSERHLKLGKQNQWTKFYGPIPDQPKFEG